MINVPDEVQVETWQVGGTTPMWTPRHADALLADIDALLNAGQASHAALVVIDVAERSDVAVWHGHLGQDAIAQSMAEAIAETMRPRDLVERDPEGRFVLLLQQTDRRSVETDLTAIAERVAKAPIEVEGFRTFLTPVIGSVPVGSGPLDAWTVRDRAYRSLEASRAHLDLQPVEWSDALDGTADTTDAATSRWTRLPSRLRTPGQIAATFILGLGLPFLGYLLLGAVGIDVTGVAYLVIVVSLLGTALMILTEGLLATDPKRPPKRAAAPAPRATAIIAAYLPNEADVIMDTVRSFLAVDYPDLQVVLAYNTPKQLPVEAELLTLAGQDPRFVPFRVDGSTSKAQNVNAALSIVDGEFVGVFDADHNPDPNSFHRAWRWLSHGYDVVQGHCVVRNGADSLVARTVAVEFESIYAVSHPGRARLHGFGIFGGSNGYWRTDALRATRMRGSMLTEDIDSSLRLVLAGGRIANDPGLVSRELGPATLKALWNQRLRWAQGWFQVSRRHLRSAWTNPTLRIRQRLGMTILLGWREVYPWLSMQMIPLLAYSLVAKGAGSVEWLVPLFVLTTLMTMSTGPIQALFAWRLAEPSVKKHGGWFVFHVLVTSLVYTEFKNVIARVAQIKELSGERSWKVTPRPTAPGEDRPTPSTMTSARTAGEPA
jgi:cellulose synthase/poly-beta-1,6-N-acetylglucosamine synthase-like glycosyltransferase/GGDEF domain-containing protein